jgi:hypothetical protein
MGYIIKDTSSLIVTRLTDYGRQQMSKGNFNITYFQVGDSEVCYDCITNFNQSFGMVLDAEYNANNGTPIPQKNQANIKYPLFVDSNSGSTYGIPVNANYVDSIYNTAAPRGFFTGTTGSPYVYSAWTTSAYTINPNYEVDYSNLQGGTILELEYSSVDATVSGQCVPGQFISVWYGGSYSPVSDVSPMLFYKIVGVTGNTSGASASVQVEVDRELPDYSNLSGTAPVLIYPTGMTALYDSYTPQYQWDTDVFNFESNCDISQSDVKVWNMNSPWTESPAGVYSNTVQDFNQYGSTAYTGTKEYLGYNSDNGQVDTDSTYYYNSLLDKIILSPSDQKAIAIIHYTNQSIDNWYGEKFATQPYDVNSPGATGQARNFRLSIPWLMWHKNTGTTIGQEFYIDPQGFDLLTPYYIESTKNANMANPGLRYYHLWDTNPSVNGNANRVGKVWPDLKIVTIDDDELVAVLNGKSNRNWTLPAPRLSLVSPYTMNNTLSNNDGVLSADTQTMWVTYRFNTTGATDSLHCNYYSKIVGPSTGCTDNSQNVILNFGNEFNFLLNSSTSTPSGYSATELIVLAQIVTGNTRPDPTDWVEINVMDQLSATSVNGLITASGMTGTTIQITQSNYNSGTPYNLTNYIDLPINNLSGVTYNFGDDYFFYGNIQTDIQATIYVMNYLCNLGQSQFNDSSNPTWTGTAPYVTEVGLYDLNKNLMVISKIQSPEKRQGIQQYAIKLDF